MKSWLLYTGKTEKMQKSKDPKTVRAFLAGISLPEPVTMAKSSTAVYSFVNTCKGSMKNIFFYINNEK